MSSLLVSRRTCRLINIYKKQLEMLNRLYMQEMRAGNSENRERIFSIEEKLRQRASYLIQVLYVEGAA